MKTVGKFHLEYALAIAGMFLIAVPKAVPAAPFVGSVTLEQARAAEGARDYRKAVAQFRKAMGFPETQVMALVGLARSLVGLGEVSEALEVLRDYLQKSEPFSIEVRVTLVDVLMVSRDYSEALRELDRIRTLRPRLSAERERRGEALLALKRYEECVSVLTPHLRENPQSTRSRLHRAKALLALDKMSEAARDLKQIVEDRPADPDHFLLYAQALEGTSQWNEAEKALLQALRLDPHAAETQARVGMHYFSRGRFAESLPFLKRSLEIDPSRVQQSLMLARAYVAAKQSRNAEQVLLNALQVSPDHEDCLLELSRIYFDQGTLDKAGALLRDFVKAHPERSQPALLFTKIALGVDRADLADETMKAFHSRGAENAESSLLHAFVKNQLGEQAEMIQILEKARQKYPKDPFIPFNLGLALQKLDREAEAIQAYQSVSAGSATFAKARVNQALLLEKRGQLAEAARALSDALISEPHQEDVKIKLVEMRARVQKTVERAPAARSVKSVKSVKEDSP